VGKREPEFLDMKRLPFLTKCIMETLRLWPVVPNGTFRQLSYDDEVKGPGGKMVKLPKGTLVQVITVGRHRNKDLWGPSADSFDPDREWEDDEIWHNKVYRIRFTLSPRPIHPAFRIAAA
jgi:cytochrome P450